MYGQSRYGGIHYARDSDKSGNQNEYFVDLARYVPPFVAELSELAQVYRTEGHEAGWLRFTFYDLLDQCFVKTATWGLVLWEKEYGITTNFFLTYEQRREVILAKMRGQETTTVEAVHRAAVSITGVETEVIEEYAEYYFVIRFTGTYGIPPNMQQLIDILEEIKPAHLGFSFQYRYVIWNELRPYVWNDLKVYTWDGLRVNRIDKFVRWQNLTDRSWKNLESRAWHKVKEIEEAKT